MVEAMTYDSLINDIKEYAERNDTPFITQVPRFLMLAENRLADEVSGLGSERTVSFNLEIGNPIYEKPMRWRETKEFSIRNASSRVVYLKPRSLAYCRLYSSESSNTVPQFYSDYNYEHFYLAATPDDDYAAELIYYERPEPLSDENQTNWTTQYAPQLILYATLLEAQPFLKRPERIQEFLGLYQNAASAVMGKEAVRKSDNAVTRNKQ